MSTTTKNAVEEKELDNLESVIGCFLAQPDYDELYETRIQKLVFYSEVYCVVHYRRRMTNAEFRPYMYGAYSKDIRQVLADMEGIHRRRDIRHGNRTTAYSIDESSQVDIDPTREKIIDKVHSYTFQMETETLAQFSKASWLFKETRYNHPMKFPEFAEALEKHPDIQTEIEEELPEKIPEDDIDKSTLVSISSRNS